MKRRDFLKTTSIAATAWMAGALPATGQAKTQKRPNILWISCEDMSPDLACYGDDYAVAPNLDKFAKEGVVYDRCFSHAGVCAPARSGIITGMYPSSIGTNQMRCAGVPPAEVKCFTEYLRAAGYYCTNAQKTDYQFAPPVTAWDQCDKKAHWRHRDAEDQPFFAVINLTVTHESQSRSNGKGVRAPLDTLEERHDPAKATLPPYYPDTPATRADWAQYHDTITLMDRQLGDILAQLEADGLAEDTIVCFWGDHGRGLPRAKRWLYDSGTLVPYILRVPEQYRDWAMPDNPTAAVPGQRNGDLIAFVDFAPTMLSLCGIDIPDHMQGQAFLGPQMASPRDYVYGARDRMDETYDCIRSVRDKRFKYLRNYMSHVPCSQKLEYLEMMPTMQDWRRLHIEGKLNEVQSQYFQCPKPVEELFDTDTDPHEINNLAEDPAYKDVLDRLRKEHSAWMHKINDIGLMPEAEFDAIKRLDDVMEETMPPVMTWEGERYSLDSDTSGASIAYRIGKSPWKLYSAPLKLSNTEAKQLCAKAGRIGFRDSGEVTLTTAPETSAPQVYTHWREKLPADLLDRLLAVKAWDGKGTPAIPAYTKALKEPIASVRYWAVVGLHECAKAGEDTRALLEPMLEDPAPVVRLQAAWALCDAGQGEAMLPRIMKDYTDHKVGSVRHYAAIVLNHIGEAARPAIPLLYKGLKDKNDYVQRVSHHALVGLGEDIPPRR